MLSANEIKEKKIEGSLDIIAYECHKIIKAQMENCICKIKIGNEQGTGFFCEVNLDNTNLKLLITNNHIIDEKLIKSNNTKIALVFDGINKSQIIDIKNRKYYSDNVIDITIIELKYEDNIENYLELDKLTINNIKNNINDEESNKIYEGDQIYLIQYPEGNLSVSYGLLKYINKQKNIFFHSCNTEQGSSGSPIINIKNNKIIGIHIGSAGGNNKGSFLDKSIKKFIDIINNDKDEQLILKFNKKYDTKINKYDKKLDFYKKEICDDGLIFLSSINFKELEKLNLWENNISEINCLKNFNFEKLIGLKLSRNEIKDISPLTQINFYSLKSLWLIDNIIEDISELKNIKCKILSDLGLDHNHIISIEVFEKVDLPELENLYLRDNKISEITIFEKTNFKKLKNLDLGKNSLVKESVDFIKDILSKKYENLKIKF